MRGLFKAVFFYFFFTLGISSSSEIPPPNTVDSAQYFVSTCEIYNSSGELVRRFSGILCAYFDNGSLVTSRGESLLFQDAEMKRVKEIHEIFPHHQIQLTDNNEVLVMGSEFSKIKNDSVRFDTLTVFSSKGVKLKSYSFKKQYKKLVKRKVITDHLSPFDWDEQNKSRADKELLHVNSFYRIPKQIKPLKSSFFKEGNYVVNSLSSQNLFIFNKSLTKIIAFLPKSQGKNTCPMLHDVQPTSDGRLLVYNNYDFLKNENARRSKIEIFDESFKFLLFSYGREFPNAFYSRVAGGVQSLPDGRFLFSETLGGKARVLYLDQNLVESEVIIKWVNPGMEIQQIKRVKLDLFLINNKGP